MIDLESRYLLFNGAIVLLAGLLSGAPMGSAINRDKPEVTVRAWRVAHSGLTLGGVMMLTITVVISDLSLGRIMESVLVWSLIISGYGFVAALPLGAWTGQRGLKSRPNGINTVVYAGNLIGALGSMLATLILIYGAWNAL